MPLTGQIDWGGIAFGAELPTGMTWIIGEDGNHYTVASAGSPWTIGCAETNTTPFTIDQTQWRTDLASLGMGTSGTYTMDNWIPCTGTKYFCIMGHQRLAGASDQVGVWYKMVDIATATITGGFYYKSSLNASTGNCMSLSTLPVMGASTLISGSVYAATRLTNDAFVGLQNVSVVMKLPSPTATTVDTSAGSWGNRVTLMPYSVSPTSSRQYGGFAGIIPDPSGVRIYSYVGTAELASAGGTLYGLTTPGMVSTVISGASNSGIHDVSSDFGMPFADAGLNFAGASGTSRDDYVSPSVSPDGTEITFCRVFSDSKQETRVRRFSFNPLTGAVASIAAAFDIQFTATATGGVPEWVQAYKDGDELQFAGRDTHSLLLGFDTLSAPLGSGGRRFLSASRIMRAA